MSKILEVIGVPSRLRLTRKTTSLVRVLSTSISARRTSCDGSGRVHCLITQIELLKMQKIGQFVDDPVRMKDTGLLLLSVRYFLILSVVSSFSDLSMS